MEPKKPCQMCIFGTVSLAGMALFAFAKIVSTLLQKKTSVPEQFKALTFSDEQLTIDNFEEVLKKHTNRFNDSGILEEILPRQFIEETQLSKISNNFPYGKGNQDLLSLTKSLNEPFWDLLDRGGKRWRPALGEFIAETFNKSHIAACCEMVHNASLVLDDIEDSSEVRRGKPCLHLLFGVDVSMNSGSFMYFYPLHYIIKNQVYPLHIQNKLMRIFLEEMVHIHLGQGWDIFWHNQDRMQGRSVSEQQYIQMVSHKTGVLARMIVRFTCAVLELSDDISGKLSVFAERVGLAFQIQDDLLNLHPGEKFLKTKGYCGEDIHEGKMSIMVIHSLKNASESDANRLKDILMMRTKEEKLIQEAIGLIEKTDSLEYARKLGNKMIKEAWEEVEKNLPNNQGKKKIRLLAEYCMSRSL